MRQILIDLYLDYRNNYISYEVMAEHHGITPNEMKVLLGVARSVFESEHPEA